MRTGKTKDNMVARFGVPRTAALIPASPSAKRGARTVPAVWRRSAALGAGLAAAALIAAFVTACGGHGRARGTIVFTRTSFDEGRVVAFYGVRPDGTGLARVPPGRVPYETYVAWARDGTKALVIDRKGTYIFDPANGARRRLRVPGLASGSFQGSVTPWSPDGKRLLFAKDVGDVVVDAETGAWHAVATSNDATEPAEWSGDGKDVLFTSDVGLYAAPADGRPARTVVEVDIPNVVAVFDPLSSSDGRWFSFSANEGNLEGLYVVRSDGSHLHRIARDVAFSTAWSPTGERLAYAGGDGIVLVDVTNGRRRRLTNETLDDPGNEPPVWSPDGRWILYRRTDLHSGASSQGHLQLWTMRADGSDRHPVTHAFPVDFGESAVWIEADLKGTAAPKLPLISVPTARTITTALPIVALAAEGNQAAVAQGFGSAADFGDTGGRVGPIVVWNPRRGTTTLVPVRGCGSASNVLLAAGRVGYDCDNSSEGYNFDHALRLGSAAIVHANGGEFSGAFLEGTAANRGTIAYDILSQTVDIKRFRFHRTTRIWESIGGRTEVVRTFRGEVDLLSLDDGRFAVLPVPCGSARYCRSGTTVSVFSAAGRIRTFALDGRPVLGAALDGRRLVVLQSKRLTVIDLGTGHRLAAWPVHLGFGSDPVLEDAAGDLAAYVVGAAIHILRLADGNDVVISTPNATEPVFARLVPGGLFYGFNKAYARRPGRVVFVTRAQLERALAFPAAAR
jgi:Tol biopolymer transport system component